MVLSRRWKTTLDQIPVGIDEVDGKRACNVAPVLLTTDGIIPLRTPHVVWLSREWGHKWRAGVILWGTWDVPEFYC